MITLKQHVRLLEKLITRGFVRSESGKEALARLTDSIGGSRANLSAARAAAIAEMKKGVAKNAKAHGPAFIQ